MQFDKGPIQTSTTTVTDYTDGEIRRQQQYKKFSENTSNQIMRRSHSYEPQPKLQPGKSCN